MKLLYMREYKDNPLAATGSMKQDIVTTDKKFKYPQVLRANLAWGSSCRVM